jgi:hypothetical protein
MIGSLLRENTSGENRVETIYPLGFPLRLSTNSEAVLATVRNQYGAWKPLVHDLSWFHKPWPELHIQVSGTAGALPPASVFHAHRHLFAYVADSRNFAICDRQTRAASVWLTEEAAADVAYLLYHFLDAIAYYLITAVYLTPVHAACVARMGRGTLLCGDSGAGKSTLSYACARRGWTYVTDDGSYLVRRLAADRLIVGNAHRIRLRPEAAHVFPELTEHTPTVRGNGKSSLELWTRRLSSIDTAPAVTIDRIVFLDRKTTGRARLRPYPKSDALAWCRQAFYHWDPAIGAEQDATASLLIDASRVETLEYAEPEGAVDALDLV